MVLPVRTLEGSLATKYDRVAADIRRRVASGVLRPGDQLPTEAELATTHHVSAATIRSALDVVEAEGLIERKHGKGTFVTQPRQRLRRTPERYHWEKERVLIALAGRQATGATEYDSGLDVGDLDFRAEYERTTADEDLAAAFEVPVGTQLLRRTYWTTKKGERGPLGIGISHLVLSMIEANQDLLDVNREPWPGGTQHQLSTVGIEIDSITDEVRARPATEDEAQELDSRPGAPLLTIRKTSVDTAGRVVEVADVIWPSDRIELAYKTQLTRSAK